MKKLIFFLSIMVFPVIMFAQQTVTGTVTDEYGMTLPGVNVSVRGTFIGSATDGDGRFSIQASQDDVLVFRFIGYKTIEIPVTGVAHMNVTMEPDIIGLDEVVVVGYGTSTRREVTGSISSLSSDDFNTGNIADPVNLIQGKVAGLHIVRPSGADPNAGFQLQLRGLTTLSGGQGPLIIIDGVIGGDLNSVIVEEIESIDVLKDGSAAAIYGTRGTNGVIIITTKRARPGETSFEFSTYMATQSVTNQLRNLTAEEYRQVTREQFGPDVAAQLDGGHSTDWFDEITRTPIDQYYNLAMGGGTQSFNYRAAVNYRTSQGLVRNSGNERFQARMTANQKAFNDRLDIDYNLSYSQTDRQLSQHWALQQAFRYNPTEPVYDPDNTFAGGYFRNPGPFLYYNPVAMINERVRDRSEQALTGSVRANLKITSNFSATVFGSSYRESWIGGDYRTRYFPEGIGSNGIAERSSRMYNTKLFEAFLDYQNSFGRHEFRTIGGYSFNEGSFEQLWSSNSNFDSDLFSYHNMGAGLSLGDGTATLGSSKESNRLIAFFGRATYNYAQKYLLSASLRYEGSSRFGANHKWGYFPAVSAAWRMNEENFMSNANWINELKIRAGYGVTGNQDIGSYRSLQLLTTGGRVLYDGQWINTYRPASNPNPELKWERKGEFNVGVDFAAFSSRLGVTLDYYDRTTSDLLYWYSVPVPPNLYNTLYTNVGVMTNKGIEATVNYNVVRTQDFTWNTTVLYNRNRNMLESFSDQARGYELTHLRTGWFGVDLDTWTQQILEGGPIGNFVAPVFLGLDENGHPIYKDNNGDGIINELDREVVGNAHPKFQLGFNNTFSYKNWDLGIFFRGVFGHSILNAHRMYYENFAYLGGKNILYSALERPNYKGMAEYSSQYVEDASYVKLDNLSIGYTFNNIGAIQNARIFITGQQLITITGYKGVDPEMSIFGLEPGIDRDSYYPRTRTITAGLSFNF
jgi:TonB-dependent starch-binding outer membrane protein SusC